MNFSFRSIFLVDSINLRRELFRTRSRLKEAQRELSSQNSLTKHLSTNNLLSSDVLISDLRKDISEMGWEIKTLQKAKESLKHELEKSEREIISLESQKKSVRFSFDFSIFYFRFRSGRRSQRDDYA